jgi:D-lactate dehydrogenase
MRVAVFSSKPYDRLFLEAANEQYGHELVFLEPRLTAATTILAAGFTAVAVFVNDQVNAAVLQALHDGGTRLIATRSAGFNHIDLAAAQCDHHRPPGVFYPQRAARHCRDDAGECGGV